MSLALFSMEGLLFALRWMHIFFGIVWIGHLYYFNFVQGAFFAEAEATTKKEAIQKLVPRALWWFRYGALWTLVFGLAIISIRAHQMGWGSFASAWGVNITIGMVLGILMFLNVWFVIWPNQKIVIANAQGNPIPNTDPAASAAKAGLASRHNVLFSMPMLFFMAAARHLPVQTGTHSKYLLLTFCVAAILGLLQYNALRGKLGMMATVRGVIHAGVGLTVILYGMVEIFL
jgi:uncharacterized membrane protein